MGTLLYLVSFLQVLFQRRLLTVGTPSTSCMKPSLVIFKLQFRFEKLKTSISVKIDAFDTPILGVVATTESSLVICKYKLKAQQIKMFQGKLFKNNEQNCGVFHQRGVDFPLE